MKKTILTTLFLTLFLDLVGFSIIFPIFPALLEYYLAASEPHIILQFIINSTTSLLGEGSSYTPVLFGGILGALYSLLQFIFAPIWGRLSDRYGRRPIILFSIASMVVSYILWIFASDFGILLLSRILGGVMSGNVSVLTAAAADITSQKDRSKGMAVIGIAFALGFLIGPVFGGVFSLLDLSQFMNLSGINPFSAIALFACILTIINFIYAYFNFSETLPKNNREKKQIYRSNNILRLFSILPYPGVNAVIFGHFFFIVAFSGMETTLMFLGAERFSYSTIDITFMFIFIGILTALIQGGFVRRKAHEIGEKKMVIIGILSSIPGLLFIGFASSSLILYMGLFFLAIGMAIVVPCMASLVSLLSPHSKQGQVLGNFRSLGALARAIGPIIAATIYWRWGSKELYMLGALFLIIPFAIFKFNKKLMASK